MSISKLTLGSFAALIVTASASAQIAADLVAAPEIPAGSIFAPHTPSGFVAIGTNVWVGGEAQGLRHYIPVDPNNADPLNTGQLMFDINTEWSVGGGSCFIWCSVGEGPSYSPTSGLELYGRNITVGPNITI
jgi:hypothetical protein